MNKIIILISLVTFIVLVNFGISTKTQMNELKAEDSRLQSSISDREQMIKIKEILPKQAPVPISTAYSMVLNLITLLQSYGGVRMNVQLEGGMDSQDISSHFEDTEYKGIRGLKIRVMADKFSNETDIGTLLDDIHLLEKNTDFIISEISKDNDHLIVKGEVYGF